MGIEWRIEPKQRPGAYRHCPRCDQKRRFVSTDNFRVNGHQSRVDVWLIYQCSTCKYTWKLTIFTRVLPSSIDPKLFRKFQQNDDKEALRYSFDSSLIRQCGAEPETALPFEIIGPDLSPETFSESSTLQVDVIFQVALEVRLAQILTKKLPLSRKQTEQALKSGAIQALDDGRPRAKAPKKLNRSIQLRIDQTKIPALNT